MSVGLTLPPSSYAGIDELVDLAQIVAHYDGFYAAHQRHYPGQDPVLPRCVYDELEPGRSGGLLPWDWEAIIVADTKPPGDPNWLGKTVGEVVESIGGPSGSLPKAH